MGNIVIWGTGVSYKRFIERVSTNADYLVDNNPEKWGKTIDELIVCSPDKLIKSMDDTLVIICSMYFNDIKDQLKKYGFQDAKILNSEACTEEKLIKINLLNNKLIKKYLGKYPVTLVDVGCRGGLPHIWRDIQQYMKVIGFEPDEEEYKSLLLCKPDNFVYFNKALFNKKSDVEFFVNNNQQTSSLLPVNETYFRRFSYISRVRTVDRIRIQTDTLDNQLLEGDIDDIDFIKLDTQGSELYIMEGAVDIISKSVLGIEVEVEFLPLYEEQPLFCDVDSFLRKQGFELFDLNIRKWNRENILLDEAKLGINMENTKGQIVYADAIYFRSITEAGRVLLGKEDNEWKKSKILRFISICILYGFADYALEIANMAKVQNVFSADEYKQIIKAL